MYSKAGRATGEIFPALRHGDDILNPKIRFFKSSSVPNLIADDKLAEIAAKKFNQNGLLRDLAEILEANNTGKEVSKSPTRKMKDIKKFEPFKIMVSRDDREKALDCKKVSSNTAYYTPKYDRVDKRSLVMVDYSKNPTKRMFDEILAKEVRSASLNTSVSLPAIPNKPTYRVRGPIALDFQASRPDIIEEQRKKKVCLTDAMASPELPAILGSVPRLPRIKFSRNLPRKEIIIETAAINCPIYTPNYEFVKKRLSLVGPELGKVAGRKNVEKIPYYTHETVYDYEEYVTNNKSRVYPRVKAPTFDKMAPRERDNGTPKVLTSPINSINSKGNVSSNHLPKGFSMSEARSLFGQASMESSMMSNERSSHARG